MSFATGALPGLNRRSGWHLTDFGTPKHLFGVGNDRLHLDDEERPEMTTESKTIHVDIVVARGSVPLS